MTAFEKKFPGQEAGRLRAASVLLATVFFLLAAGDVAAQQITGRFVTSFTKWEQFDTVGVSHKVLRGFQSAILDIGQGDVVLHTNMQAATTIGDGIDESSDYRLYNLYLKARDIADAVDVSAGRVPFYYGVGMGTIDGGIVSAHTQANAYKVTLYGGVTPFSDYGVRSYGTLKDKFALGGQIVVASVENLRGTVSYMNRRSPRPSYYTVRADASTLDPVTVLIVPDPQREQIGGVDLSYALQEYSLYGRYDYDVEMGKTQRAQFGARYQMNSDLLFTLDAIRREPRIPAGSFFSQFTLKGSTEVGGGADYFVLPGIRTYVRGAYVGYDGDNSFRYTAGVGRNDVQLEVRGNTGYAGELFSVSLQGAYPLLENAVTPNAGISYVSYRVEKDAPRYDAVAAVLGATVRPAALLSFDLQGQWLNNYVMKSDFRFVGRLHFWFSDHLDLF